jgi:outer membrane protein W
MNRRAVVVLCLFTAFLIFNSDSFAQAPDTHLAIGARVSYYQIDDSTIGVDHYEFDPAPLLEGNITCFLTDVFSLEFGVGYANPEVDAEGLGVSLEFGEFETIPFLLTGRLHYWPPKSRATFYGGVGVGYYLNDFEPSNLVAATLPGWNISVDDSLGFHIAAGTELSVVDNVAINIALKYVIWNEADVGLVIPGEGSGTDEVDLDGLSIGLGIKFYF